MKSFALYPLQSVTSLIGNPKYLSIDESEKNDAVEDVLGHFPIQESIHRNLRLSDEPIASRTPVTKHPAKISLKLCEANCGLFYSALLNSSLKGTLIHKSIDKSVSKKP